MVMQNKGMCVKFVYTTWYTAAKWESWEKIHHLIELGMCYAEDQEVYSFFDKLSMGWGN